MGVFVCGRCVVGWGFDGWVRCGKGLMVVRVVLGAVVLFLVYSYLEVLVKWTRIVLRTNLKHLCRDGVPLY